MGMALDGLRFGSDGSGVGAAASCLFVSRAGIAADELEDITSLQPRINPSSWGSKRMFC